MTGDPLAEFRGPANRRRDRRLMVFLPLAAVEVVVGGTVGWALAANAHHHHRPVHWYVPAAVILGTVLLGAAEWFTIVWFHRRRHGTWLPEPAAVLGADKPVRKRVGKAFRKGRLPDDPTERALTVDLASKALRLRRLAYLLAVVIVLQVPALFVESPPARIASAVVIAALLLSLLLYVLILRRAQRVTAQNG